MRLKKLELYGFKSFAPRTEIVLGDGITGIVGPNGSGKSNIADAVRWVLGEQSAKTLRGASMSDVIFNGTQRRKPLSYCEVSLVFDNEDRALRMDYAEIMVTRRVYRNGESEYFLNQSSCRLKDIVDLFRDTGIGREGYSIIGQGRIDEILSRRSEDRRQVFEEAAGIVKFRARKEEADKKLARTLENADRVEDILEELGRRLGPLEEQSRDARLFLTLNAELKILDLNLFLIRSERATEKLNALDEELRQLQIVLSDAERNLTEKGAERDETQERIAALDERITAARDDLMAAAEAVHQSQSEGQRIAARIAARAERREALRREETEDQEKLRRLTELHESSAAGAEAASLAVEAAETALRAAQREAEIAVQAEEDAQTALDAHKSSVMDAMNRRSDLRDSQTRLKTMLSQMQTRLDEVEQSSGELQTREGELLSALTQAEARLNEERGRQTALEEGEEAAREALREAEAETVRIQARGEKLNAALGEKQSRLRLMNEWTREMEGYSQSVRRAVQYAREHSIGGVRGTLAQLIQVPARFETAIDMALGAALQNIVTDTEETAKQLIDYLKRDRLGRATFLPISAMRPKLLSERERQVLSLPGCLGPASELVKCSDDFRGIVENLLGRTVIADNLEHGIAIMRAGGHSFRLVTLDGEVMHSGGSMTGGSVQSRSVNLLSREREAAELGEQVKQGLAERDRLREEFAASQQKQKTARDQLNSAQYALHQQEIAVAREAERTAGARGDLENHRARMAETDEAVAQLQEAIAEITRQLQELDRVEETAAADPAELEKRTGELQQLVQAARAKAQAAQDKVLQGSLDVSEKRHALDVMRRDSSRYAEDCAALARQAEERAEQLRTMARDDEADGAEDGRIQAEVKQLQQRQAEKESAIRALEEQRSGLQERLRTLLSDVEALHAALTRDSDRSHRVEMQRARTDNELRALQDRVWNTWELTYAGAEEFRQKEGFNEREADRRASELSAKIRALGNVNVHAVEEYADTKARWDELNTQLDDLRKAERDLRELIDGLLSQMRTTFVSSFTLMQGYFSETFTRLFGGGHAELSLTDPDDPLNCGIEVNAQPPGKKLQLLSLLSGGERALCAIAILFAMLKLKPTPFCILDEIEAALDDANIGYYADYLKEYSESTQFIVITHRKGTMERCNALYGVAMEEQGVSRMVSVSLKDYQE